MDEILTPEDFCRFVWKSYLVERDYSLITQYADERLSIIGTGAHEFSSCMEDFIGKAQREESSWDGRFILSDDSYHSIQLKDELYLVIGQGHAKEQEHVDHLLLYEFSFRFSMVVEKGTEGWKLLHVHQSVPDNNQSEDEFFPQKFTQQSNRILKEMIQKKTKELEQRTEEAVYYSRYDYLTTLANRHYTEQQITNKMAEYPHGHLIMIDVDDFKRYNDTKGHPFGDRVLKLLATAMKECFPDDVTGRIGGDEFIIYLACDKLCDQQLEQDMKKLMEVWQKQQQLLELDEPVTLSIGISSYPKDGLNFDILWSNADQMLYQAKVQGKNKIAYQNQ